MTRSRFGKPSVVIASAAASETPPRMPLQAIATRSGTVVSPWNSHRHHDHPQHPHAHHHRRDQQRVAAQRREVAVLDALDDRRDLQPDQDEQQPVEQERGRVPERERAQARARFDDVERAGADVQAGDDRREDAGDVQLLGRHVGDERRQHGQRDVQRRVGDEPPQMGEDPAGGEPDRDAAGGDPDELERRRGRRSRRSLRPRPARPGTTVRPVASLISDSPWRIVFVRPVTPSRSSTAAALTGSVGPSTAPSTNAAAHGIPSSAFATAATAAIVTSTSPTASSPIGFQLARSSGSRR